MARGKRSLFEWLTGSSEHDFDTSFDELDEAPVVSNAPVFSRPTQSLGQQEKTTSPKRGVINNPPFGAMGAIAEPEPEGELSVDMYQTPTHLIIKAMIAGVRPEDLDVSITRDLVTIRGRRERHTEGGSDDFHFQELYWGAFSRSITLPQEIDMDGVEASEKHGLLTIRLPKIDRGKQAKIKVKAS